MGNFERNSVTTAQGPVEAFCESGPKSPSFRNRGNFLAAGRHQHVKKGTMD